MVRRKREARRLVERLADTNGALAIACADRYSLGFRGKIVFQTGRARYLRRFRDITALFVDDQRYALYGVLRIGRRWLRVRGQVCYARRECDSSDGTARRLRPGLWRPASRGHTGARREYCLIGRTVDEDGAVKVYPNKMHWVTEQRLVNCTVTGFVEGPRSARVTDAANEVLVAEARKGVSYVIE